MPTNKQSDTGANNLAGSARSAAASLAGPAVQLASGAGMLHTAADTLKGAMLDKLLGPTALFAGGLLGAVRAMKMIVDQSGILERGLKRIASIQQIQGKFETLLKSAEKATERMKELYRFTSQTPFDFSDIAEGNRVLQALSKGALAGADGMQMVGDAAAATGHSFSDTATQVGKLYAALKSGRSLDKVLFQLQFGGLVTDTLARKLEIAEQAGTDFQGMWAIVTEEMKRTEGGMKNEMKTLGALTQQIANASAVMEKAFGEPFVEAQAKAMQNTVDATKNLTPLIAKIATDSAPVLKIFTNVKNSVIEATLATKGFADGLGAAWSVAKTMAVGLAATFGANALGSVGGAAKGANSLRAKYRANQSGPAHQAGVSRSKDLGAQAAAAFSANLFGAAAALKVQSVWAGVSAAAMSLHTAAMAMATKGTAGFSVVTYAASISLGVLTAASKLAWTAITSLGRSLVLVMANPLAMALTAVAGLTLGLKSHWEEVARVNKGYTDFMQTLAGVTSSLRDTLKAMKDVDQYRAGIVQADEAEKKVIGQMKALGARPADIQQYSFGADMKVRPTSLRDNGGADWDNQRAAANEALRKVRATRKAMQEKLGGLAPGADERARTVDNVRADMRNADAAEQERMGRASDMERRRMLQKRIQRRLVEEASGRETEAGRLNPEIFKDAPTELMKVATQIGDLQAAGEKVPEQLFERQAQLNAFADTWRDMRPQIETDATEVRNINENLRQSLGGIASERMSNNAITNGRPQAARTAQEAAARDQKVQEYDRLGLSADQARSDFDASVRAQAMLTQPRIVADSLQSVGGGGNSAGSSPMLAAQKRIEGYSAATVRLLQEIRDMDGGGAAMK